MAVDSLWSSRTLFMPMDGPDSTTDGVVDVKGHAVTLVGNTQIKTAQSITGGSSCYFDGTGDRITFAASADWDMSGGNFCIEFCIRANALPSASNFFRPFLFGTNGSTAGLQVYILDTGAIGCGTPVGGNTTVLSAAGEIAANTWARIEISCSGGSARIFKDGSLIAGPTTITAPVSSSSNTLAIGYDSGAGEQFAGYIDRIRVSRVAGHTAAFTSDDNPFPRPTISGVVLNSSAAPDEKTVIVRDRNTQLYLGGANSDPSTGAYVFYPPDFGEVQVERVDALFDPDFHLVRLLCPFTSSLADSVGNAVTANNGAALSSAVGNPFGAGNALFLDGTNDYLSIPGTAFSFTKVTIEAWIRPSVLTGYRPFYAGENSRLAFYLLGTTLELGIWGISGIVTKTSAITVANVWRHVAAVLDGGMASLFVDGSKVASAGYSSSIVAPSTLKIGKTDGTDYFAGYIGPIRVTAAARKITAAPSGPFLFSPTDGGSGENALIYDRVIPG